jgi:AGCS family alanine or glycine:cation symporter
LVIKAYRFLYVAMVAVGPYLTLSVVWGIADIFNGLMAFPNLVALMLLSPVVVRVTRDFLDRSGK